MTSASCCSATGSGLLSSSSCSWSTMAIMQLRRLATLAHTLSWRSRMSNRSLDSGRGHKLHKQPSWFSGLAKTKYHRRYLTLRSVLFSCSKGQQEIAVWTVQYYSHSVWTVSSFLFLCLSSIWLQMNRCFLHCVCANATICVSPRPVSGRAYFGCFRHMV